MTETEMNIMQDAINTFGVPAQVDVAIEEMSELTKALIKYRRKPSLETLMNIIEEKEDVKIMMEQLDMIYGTSEEIREFKIKRLGRRLQEHGT